MYRYKNILLRILCVALLVVSCTNIAYAHSGRTDSSGGHRDNKNVSGLGSYHYHCGGYPAHLHTSGYCPYRDTFPSSVSVKAEKTSLYLGESTTINGSVYPSNACNTQIDWECSDSSVISLRNNTIEAVGFGTATITGTSFNGKTASIKITVKEKPVELVSIEEELISLELGKTFNVQATVNPTDATNTELEWKSENPDIVTVTADGVITAMACGKTTIYAAANNGISDSVTVEVNEIVATSIAIEGDSQIQIGSTTNLQAVFTPHDTTVQDVTWEISDTSIAEISQEGVLNALNIGTATVYAKQKDVETSIQIEVMPINVSEIIITPSSDEKINIGESMDFSAEVLPENATYPAVTWRTNDENIATNDENGVLQAHKSGEVIVIAETEDGCTAEYPLKINNPIQGVIVGVGVVGGIAAAAVVIKKKKKI